MSNLDQLLSSIPTAPFIIVGALITALVAFAVQRRNNRATIINKFIGILSSDIAALASADNVDIDAFAILEFRLTAQHEAFITTQNAVDFFRKRRLKKAWSEYYGEEGEQKWWLPNEYSTLLSNQLQNTVENTKQLAIHRLKSIIQLCK